MKWLKQTAFLLCLLQGAVARLHAQPGTLSLSASTLEFAALSPDLAIPTQTVLVSTTVPFETSVGYMSPEEGWLSAESAAGKVVIAANARGLATGFYMGYVKINTGKSSAAVTITLKVGEPKGVQVIRHRPEAVAAVGTPAITATLTADPVGDIVFDAKVGGPTITKTITISSTAAENFYIYGSYSGWLTIPIDDKPLPATLSFVASPSSFNAPIQVQSTLIFVGTVSGAQLPVKFIMNVTAGTAGGVSASPNQVYFPSQVAGNTTAGTATIALTSSATTAFTAVSGASWLTVSPTSGTTTGDVNSPTTLTLSASAATLTPNSYSTTVTITGGQGSITIPVYLTVTGGAAPTLAASPASLSFTQTIGGTLPDAQTVSLTSSVATSFSVTTSASWLTTNLTSAAVGTTNTLTVSANAAGLSAGTIQASILVTAGTTTINIPVTFSVNTVPPSITATPTALSFTQILGGPLPGAKIVVDSKNPTQFIASSNAPWLTVTPSTRVTTMQEISAFVTQNILAVGTYQAAITLNGGTSPVTVPVTLTVSGAAISATPASLSFSQAPGGVNPAAQTFRIDSNVTANFTAVSNANWLNVSPSNGTAPGVVTVSINGSSLAVGSYQSSVTITTATTSFDVPVVLSVAVPILTVNVFPGAVDFTAAVGASGASAPQPKSVNVTSSGGPFSFTASASTVDKGNWLTVTPASSTTPGQISAAININGMAQGQYTGAITITPADLTIATRVIPVTLTLTGAGTNGVAVKSVLNAASLQPGPLSPGEIISIFGTGLGTTAGAGATVSSAGAINTSIGDTRVYFEGIPSPMLYARADQINAIVPYGVYGRFAASLQVEVAGSRSEAVQLRIDPSAPGVFTATGTGSGQGAIVNQDGTINSPIYPAPRGSIVSIYGTGEGQTRPAGQDGRIITTDVRPPVGTVVVKIAGATADVLYAGSAPGMVSGAFQINVKIPENTPIGGQITIEVSVAGNPSQTGVMIAVK